MVQKKIKIEMLQDAELNSLPVVINTSETQILLSGNVHSQAQKQKAGAIAQKNAGDRQVINQIKVGN
ncbi:MAG: BON domain-containing protein [Desulfobacter sp.]|nr:BON domain-containing protein [Desulfobacter sp.]